MKAQITIQMDTAAFADYPGAELARILRKLADDMEGAPFPESSSDTVVANLRDINGNTVGTMEATQ